MDAIWKFLLLLLFGPALFLVGLQLLLIAVAAVLPYVVLLGIVAGIAAGISAGFVLRRRLPPRNGGQHPLPPGGAPVNPVRRPRGVRARAPQDWWL